MNEFVIAIFPDADKADEGFHALEALHAEGSVTLYGTIVVRREEDGLLTIKERDQGPVRAGVGSLVGGLIGLFAAPAGAMREDRREHLRTEVSEELLEDIVQELVPGMFAVIAEVSRELNTPLEPRMIALGGKVLRERRVDLADDLIEKRVGARVVDLARCKAERAVATAETLGSRLEAEIGDAQDKLRRTAEKALKRIDDTKEEMEAKLKALEAQASTTKSTVKAQIERRIAELRQDFGERERKLSHAWDLAQEALRP